MGKVVAIVEARMGSRRLPGKVLLPAGGKPMLGHLLGRLQRSKQIHQIVLATSQNPSDDPLESLAKEMGIGFFRGSEEDVLSRVLGAARAHGAEVICEITGDCVLLDPEIVDHVIRNFQSGGADYVSNVMELSYPVGMDAQVYRTDLLAKVSQLTQDPLDREHVTRYLLQRPSEFNLRNVFAPPDLTWPELWLVLDEPADYDFLKKIIEHFSSLDPHFGCEEIIHLLKKNPLWVEAVASVKRKGLNE